MYTAAIIGLGNIGMGYDYECPDDSLIITHASAFHYHPGFELIGAVDNDGDKRKRFEKKYQKNAYSSIEDLFSKHSPKVVSIAVPTEFHYYSFKKIIQYNISAIVLEKPIADNIEDGEEIVNEAERKNIPVLVNYMRRFEPGVQRIKRFIDLNEIGGIFKGVVFYSKGILNNGSHFIDMLTLLLGKPVEVKVLCKGRIWNQKDPEPDILLKFKNAEIYFLACKEEFYSIAEMELYGTKGKLLYKNGGSNIEYYKSITDPIYPDYTILSKEPSIIHSELNKSQYYVLNNLKNYLDGKVSQLNSNGKTAIQTLNIVDEIIRQSKVK